MIITQTPLRISFLGGNTDFHEYFLNYGGLVISTTIDKHVYCILNKRNDDKIIVNYTSREEVDDVTSIDHDLVREALRLTGVTKGIEISFLADIPTEGCGLGSSSAVTIGLLNALHTYLGQSVSSKQLAEEAVKIEYGILKRPIGIQDQHAIAMGGLRAIEFNQIGEVFGRTIEMDPVQKELFRRSLILFYTKITRKAESILSSIDISESTPLLHQNKQLAKDGIEALLKGDIERFGSLLHTYWEVKKQLSDKISNYEIDKMYQLAIDAGAIGGKVIGAGGGGFLLVMADDNQDKVREALKGYQDLSFKFVDYGSRVIFNNG